MKNTKGIKKPQNDVAKKGNENLGTDKSTTGPEEFEEQRSMNIRMKPQPFQSSGNSDKKKIKPAKNS